MPNTGERREITGRVNAREAETVQEAKTLVAKTKRASRVADTKSQSRRNQEMGMPSGVPKNKP
jgi:hypothetical protein